jgi:hypothetical protein
MPRLFRLIALALPLALLPRPSVADDKKGPAPKSLADETAYLVEKNGIAGWRSDAVTITQDQGKTKGQGQLHLFFGPKDVWLRVAQGKSTVASPPFKFELAESDGKRYIKVLQVNPKDDTDRKTFGELEYTLKPGELTIKGGTVPNWAGWEVDLSKPITFKPGK